MNELLKASNWISGLQWLFFIFANTVVIPVTIGAAFQLSQEKIIFLLQFSFITVGIACMIQALIGHRRAIMEGQSGLWWGIILTLCSTAGIQGISLETLGGSLATGIIISGILTIIIGLTGTGQYLSKFFNPAVMGVFMFLFGTNLIRIFLKGMLGLPFGSNAEKASVNVPVALLSIIIAIIVMIISIKAPAYIARYALLIGIIVGWTVYSILFHSKHSSEEAGSFSFHIFPIGEPAWNSGIIITAVIAGLLNLANTFGALKGTDAMYQSETTKKQYRSSLTISGLFVSISGLFGLVPFAPYVSSIGFLSQTQILKRIPFIIGGFMFVIMGVIPLIGHLFSLLPLSVGSAVLFVAYLQLFNSSFHFFKQVKFNTVNVYRSAIPVFVGIIIMTLPPSTFATLPGIIRPIMSNGLLVGILLALILENFFSWDRYGLPKEKQSKNV
ncbi:xanthine/uracil permease [Scopulibacillus daqui]|uniref:Xanthine/uracil permease n=1 Tax=Scopulibacillus daqui TaxID=1469162 RepID=A0ABS2Q2X2_9BACL|nr:uracil/xanthine transporter [Scopulibacillus daqui]MBM7645877.1 xanthine/uracil permease [Scopulibacillus daqui]